MAAAVFTTPESADARFINEAKTSVKRKVKV